MIILKEPMAGTDKHGEPFSKTVGDKVELDDKSEKSLIDNDMAEPAKKSKK